MGNSYGGCDADARCVPPCLDWMPCGRLSMFAMNDQASGCPGRSRPRPSGAVGAKRGQPAAVCGSGQTVHLTVCLVVRFRCPRAAPCCADSRATAQDRSSNFPTATATGTATSRTVHCVRTGSSKVQILLGARCFPSAPAPCVR